MITYIYKLSDPITGKIKYVGKSNDPKKRLSDHIYNCDRTITHKNNWVKSLLEKGERPILEILEVVDQSNWERHEIYWIEKLRDEGHDLTNMDKGGQGTTRHSYNTIDKLRLIHKERPNYNHCEDRTHIIDKDTLYQKYITENLSLNKCAEFFSVSKHTIFRNITEYNFKKDKSNWIDQLSTKEKMIINQYTLDGTFIKKWVGLKSIQDELGLNWSVILNCCKGMSNKSQGYIWRFYGDDIHRPIICNKSKLSVLQIDSHGKIVNEFKSIKNASELTSISRTSIGYCCRGKLKSAGGYIWRYKNDYDQIPMVN